MFCSNCGNEVTDNSKFCPECGHNLTKKESNNTVFLFIILVLVVLVILVFACFLYGKRNDKNDDIETIEEVKENGSVDSNDGVDDDSNEYVDQDQELLEEYTNVVADIFFGALAEIDEDSELIRGEWFDIYEERELDSMEELFELASDDNTLIINENSHFGYLILTNMNAYSFEEINDRFKSSKANHKNLKIEFIYNEDLNDIWYDVIGKIDGDSGELEYKVVYDGRHDEIIDKARSSADNDLLNSIYIACATTYSDPDIMELPPVGIVYVDNSTDYGREVLFCLGVESLDDLTFKSKSANNNDLTITLDENENFTVSITGTNGQLEVYGGAW